ncbi:MAG: hypothetical protein U0746_19875 [Gemmataceae bacterium]
MTAMSKRRLGVLATVAAAAVLTIAVAAYVRHRCDARRLAEQVAALDAADPHWRLDDLVASLRTTPLPDDENLCNKLAEASAALGPYVSRYQERCELMAALSPNVRLAPDQWRFVIAGVEANEDAIAAVFQFERYPRGRHADSYPGGGYDTANRSCNPGTDVRTGLLHDLFLTTVQRGDWAAALSLVRGDLNVGRSYRDEPLIPTQRFRTYLRKDAVRGLERLLGHAELTDAQLTDLRREFATELADDLMQLSARGELALADRIAEMTRRGEFPASVFRRASQGLTAPTGTSDKVRDWVVDQVGVVAVGDHADVLTDAWQAVEAIRRPWPERWRAVQVLMPPRNCRHWRLGLMPLIDASRFARDEARVRCALAAIAAERYRLAHGGWPAALADLGPLPGDPFAAGPLRYRRTADGVEIYVPTPDYDDMSQDWIDPPVGGLTRKTGIGFHLYDPTHRNRKPGATP